MTVLIGSGNVASWIARKLYLSPEFAVKQVYSPNLEHAKVLADSVDAEAIDNLKLIDPNGTLYLFSLKDDTYPSVLSQLPFKLPLALHTSGTVSQQIFTQYADTFGVIYPLQTFTKSVPVMPAEVPIIVQNDALKNNTNTVERLAHLLSDTVYHLDEDQRFTMHLAAVFACNFGNALYHIADELLQHQNLNFEILKPLLLETVRKLDYLSPAKAQTGPARRHDKGVMQKHLESLPNEQLRQIYSLLSDYIENDTL